MRHETWSLKVFYMRILQLASSPLLSVSTGKAYQLEAPHLNRITATVPNRDTSFPTNFRMSETIMHLEKSHDLQGLHCPSPLE